MPDLRLKPGLCGVDITPEDEEQWELFQSLFFAPQAKSTPKAKGKAKPKAKGVAKRRSMKAASYHRKAAYRHLCALDRLLLLLLGWGLSHLSP
eukprot:11159382-Lingulodinium_polyedra.AAC.1